MNYVELSLAATQSNYTFFHLVNEVHGATDCPGVFNFGLNQEGEKPSGFQAGLASSNEEDL